MQRVVVAGGGFARKQSPSLVAVIATALGDHRVVLTDGERIEAGTTVWTAGM
jgi:hypothetical protein